MKLHVHDPKSYSAFAIPGLVSSTALQNGGITYGIIPLALTGRRVEDAVLKSRGNDGRACGVSKEGTGAEMLKGDYDGRLRTEVVSSMHDVSLIVFLRLACYLYLIVALMIEESTNG